MHSYPYRVCRINTFGSKIVVGKDQEGNNVEHAVHEYHDTLQNIYCGDFKKSDESKDFCEATGRTTLSYTKFKEGAFMCPCIKEPTMRVCVDEIETGFSELVYSMKEIMRRSRTKCTCGFCKNEDCRKKELKDGML